MTFSQKVERRVSISSSRWSRPTPWRFAATVPAAVLVALAGPAYAARLNAVGPISMLATAQAPAITSPWRAASDTAASWKPVVHGADREFVQRFEEPGSDTVIRYVALYGLRATGDALTTTGNRLADDKDWHITGYGKAEAMFANQPALVASAEVVSGQRRRLVWSFYVVDGKIAAGLIEAKLLRARALLLDRDPVAAFVAISASMNDPKNSAERQLNRFLAASQPFTQYLARLPR